MVSDVFLELNRMKTKEMCIGFGHYHPNPVNTTINGQVVEIVKSYKYFGIIINNRLSFEGNSDMYG